MFFNPNMMGTNGFDLPKVPTVKELWKKEKSEYRHWVILFAIALLALTALATTILVINSMNFTTISKWIQDYNNGTDANKLLPGQPNYMDEKSANMSAIWEIAPNAFQVIGLLTAATLFVSTIFKVYKQQSFAHLSRWSTWMVGFAAFMSVLNLISMMWNRAVMDYLTSTPSGIFAIVFYVLSIVIWALISAPLARIRVAFARSAYVEKMQADPQFQQAKAQYEAMMRAAQGMQGAQSPFGPAPVAPQTTTDANGQVVTPATPEVSPEKKRLEGMSLAQLKKVAAELSISGASSMKKDELIEAILRVTQGDK